MPDGRSGKWRSGRTLSCAMFGYAYHAGWIVPQVDLASYAVAPTSWIALCGGFVMGCGLVLACLYKLHGLLEYLGSLAIPP